MALRQPINKKENISRYSLFVFLGEGSFLLSPPVALLSNHFFCNLCYLTTTIASNHNLS